MASSPKTSDEVEAAIRDGYTQSHSIGDVSKVEHAWDKAMESGTSSPNTDPFAFIKTFYSQNQDTIKSTATGLLALTADGKSIESAVSNFAETAKVLITGLDALAQVHPAIGVAVIAFKLVVTFDLTRRENNKKVLALKIEMQDMMAVLFELRHIRDPMEKGPDGSPLGARIQKLMETIANDIKDAGSACDAYLKKSFLARTLKSKIYESKLAEYGSKFEDNKADIEQALAMHTARGVDAANEKLDTQGLKLDEMSDKFDHFLKIFERLDSPRELEIQMFLEDNGGAKRCIEDDRLLNRLVLKGGQGLLDADATAGRSDDLMNARKMLLKEFHEDVDKMLEDHVVVFQGKLDIQSQQLEAIQTILASGSHDRIIDPDLKTIWKEMGWKGSVKARHFVLALHDYFSDASFFQNSSISPRDTVTAASDDPVRGNGSIEAPAVDDKWALSYINVTYVQPIIEAIDDDGTGFVSIKEVNTFVTSRPSEWTLLQRLAYWAVGWHISISSYREKIYAQIQKIYPLLEHLHPANRGTVDNYLRCIPLARLEHILRSTKSTEMSRHDSELAKLVEAFEAMEEERLQKNFASVAYELDTPETVTLVTGPGRIERYLFPLAYIVLKHTHRLIILACKYIIQEEELWVAAHSLRSIFRVVDERIRRMTGIFRQVQTDVNMKLGVFAFGMFQVYYNKIYDPETARIVETDNSVFKWQSDSSQVEEVKDLKDEIASVPITELKREPVDLAVLGKCLPAAEVPPIIDETTPIGHWGGHLWQKTSNGSYLSAHGLMELRISSLKDGKFIGVGQSLLGIIAISGTLDAENNLKFSLEYEKSDEPVDCEGKFDPTRQGIRCSWIEKSFEPYDQSCDDGIFILWRTPSHLNKFREELDNDKRSLVRSRWAFAREAVLYEVRRNSWSWAYLKARISEVRRVMDLTIRHRIGSRNMTPGSEISRDERLELLSLQRSTHIQISRLATMLAEFHLTRILAKHDGITCDSCQRYIYEARIICLVCVDKDFVNTMDLCRPCLNASTSRGKLNHNPSHSMIKYEHVIHNYAYLWSSRDLVPVLKAHLKAAAEAAKATSDKTKGDDAVADTSPDEAHDPQPHLVVLCCCCSKPVTVPCWFCRFCVSNTFLCSDCEEKRIAPPVGHPHRLDHPRIRIATLDPDPQILPNKLDPDERLAALELKVDAQTMQLQSMVQERMNQLGTIIQDRTSQLERMVQDCSTQLEVRMEDKLTQLDAKVQERFTRLESNVQERLTTLETLLRQVLVARAEQATSSTRP